jgi:glycosyltransferase involved in cell wall biosynthesis
MVSIVVPAHNLGRYLGEAIQSVLNQDYPNIELIVLDDGSTDNTRSVLEKYAGQIHAESQPNMGQVNTLNKGWRMSKGDILGFISADDALLPGAVGKAVACLEASPDAVLTYCDFNLIDADSRPVRRIRTPEFNYDEMLVDVICPPGPGAFFRRSAFEAVGLWDSSLKIMLDYEYWLRLGLRGRFIRIPEVLALYRVHDVSQTFAGFDESRAQEPVSVVSRAFEMQGLPKRLLRRKREALSNANLVSAQLNLRAGRVRAGFLRLRDAFFLYPWNLFTRRSARRLLNVLFNRLGHKTLHRLRPMLDRVGQ